MVTKIPMYIRLMVPPKSIKSIKSIKLIKFHENYKYLNYSLDYLKDIRIKYFLY
jgi:hypothetical protein